MLIMYRALIAGFTTTQYVVRGFATTHTLHMLSLFTSSVHAAAEVELHT